MPALPLYLVRHEDAEPSGMVPDEHRALTTTGRRRMRKTSRFLLEQGVAIDTILTSPLVRAVQTAEILCDGLGLDGPVLARSTIAYPPSLEALLDLVLDSPAGTRGLAVVGHEPTLGALAAALIGRQEFPISVKKGMVLGFDVRRDTREGTFRWAVVPEGPRFETGLD